MFRSLSDNLILDKNLLDSIVKLFRKDNILLVVDDLAYNFGVFLQYYLNFIGLKTSLFLDNEFIYFYNRLKGKKFGSKIYLCSTPSKQILELTDFDLIFSTKEVYGKSKNILVKPLEELENILFIPLTYAFANILQTLSGSKNLIKNDKDILNWKVNIDLEEADSKIFTRKNLFCLGRSIGYPIALEICSILKRYGGIHAEGYPAGESKHGPIALIEKNFPVISIIIKDETKKKMISSIMEMKARGATIISISQPDKEAKEISNIYIEIPEKTPLSILPIYYIKPTIEILNYHKKQ